MPTYEDDRLYIDGKPGRIDSAGVEWFACDPYPTWYRRENNELTYFYDGESYLDWGEYAWEEHERTLDPEWEEYLRLCEKFETPSNWHKKEEYDD